MSAASTQAHHPNGLTLLFDPTANCNLGCQYCYRGQRRHTSISIGDAFVVLRKVIDYNEAKGWHTLCVWHGGEPTLMGWRFFRDMFEYTRATTTALPVKHTIQTNGSMLTEELLALFADNQVPISVSLDGPLEYHDRVRRSLSGKGSHALILDSLVRARALGIEVGILMTISPENREYVRSMFDFCKDNGFSLGLTPITGDLHSRHSSLEISPKEYLETCIEVFDLWFYQKEPVIQVNPAHGVMALLLSAARYSDCFMSRNCQEYFIAVGPEGDVYLCNRFYGIGEYRYGNLLTQDIEVVLASPKRAALLERSGVTIEKCDSCQIREYCNGGCVHHAVVHGGSVESTDHLCEVYRGLVEHALSRLSAAIQKSNPN